MRAPTAPLWTHLNAGNCAKVKQNGELANKNNFPADLEICSVTFCILERTENFIRKFSLGQFDECSECSFIAEPSSSPSFIKRFVEIFFKVLDLFLQKHDIFCKIDPKGWAKIEANWMQNQPVKIKYQHLSFLSSSSFVLLIMLCCTFQYDITFWCLKSCENSKFCTFLSWKDKSHKGLRAMK